MENRFEKHPFYPEGELHNAKQLPREGRPAAVVEFKRELARQKEGLGEIQGRVIKAIRENPDASFEELYGIVEEMGPEARITQEQKEKAAQLIEQYQNRHTAIKAARKRYPGDEEFYEALFGVPPKGGIRIEETPVSLYIQCRDLEDYALIHSQNFMNRKTVGSGEKEVAARSGGVSIPTCRIDELSGAIIAQNDSSTFHLKSLRDLGGTVSRIRRETDDTLQHEEQHVVNAFFKERERSNDALEFLKEAKTQEQRKQALRRYLRAERRKFIDNPRARNEILAYFAEGASSAEIINTLNIPESKGEVFMII
ncbi:MAG: hypothetical protein HYV77_01460 [Candidatus Wildermuthbacteria bacterium]|nr:hypothetical protein [Candidatus Wildermuthbacteria bacterium]